MTTTITTMPPDRGEAAEYYFSYIAQVPPGDILTTLEGQEPDALSLFEAVSDERAGFRYAPGKWSIKEVLAHINDTERLFVFRALWFARGLEAPLPSFDQTVAAAGAAADDRPWQSHVDEFRTVRAASLSFYKNLRADAWLRRGIASGNPFSVRALAYITAGHVAHHVGVLRERYL